MKRVLLTGASGFAGSHVLRHILVNTDWFVVCPVTFRHKGLQDRIRVAVEGIPDAYKRIKIIKCDLSAPISYVTAHDFGDIDYVINLASESHVDRSIQEPTPFIINNVSLVCNLLDWARIAQPEKILHISTDEVYGPAYENHKHKEWEPHFPSNPYSASKSAQEQIVFSYWRTYGMPIAITNTMNIIGETQDPEKFVPRIMQHVYNDKAMTIHGSPTGEIGSRFYIHARNKADGLLHILKQNFPLYGEADMPLRYNIVGEKEVSNLEMAQIIAEVMGKDLKYEIVDFHSSRPGHDLRYALDGSKLADTGWKAPVSFEESIERTVKWTLNRPEWLAI